MKFSVTSIALGCWAIVGSAVIGQSQNIECLRDVPFTATRIYASQGVPTSEKIARASNGSWFVEQFNAKGIPQNITIKDVPHQRMVTLFVELKEYAISAMNPINFKTYSAQEWLDVLRGSHDKSPGPQNNHPTTTFLPATHHVVSIELPQKTPIFRKTPPKNTIEEKIDSHDRMIDPSPRTRYTR